MHNEDDSPFIRMTHRAMENIAYLSVCKRDRGEDWGEETWKKVAACIARDGLQENNSRTSTIIMAIDTYWDGPVVNRSLAGASGCANI
ncbi:hypothetical protein BJV74DRAFT_780131 [Russula compacta]|nr:hypothetical protein BJV74DRAFT_780131 [Russula compacta]